MFTTVRRKFLTRQNSHISNDCLTFLPGGLIGILNVTCLSQIPNHLTQPYSILTVPSWCVELIWFGLLKPECLHTTLRVSTLPPPLDQMRPTPNVARNPFGLTLKTHSELDPVSPYDDGRGPTSPALLLWLPSLALFPPRPHVCSPPNRQGLPVKTRVRSSPLLCSGTSSHSPSTS